MESSGQHILFQFIRICKVPTHKRVLRMRVHRYKNLKKDLPQEILPFQVYICFNFDLEYFFISGSIIILEHRV